MKLHWSPRSPFVRKVMILAHETGQAEAFERVRTVVAMNKPNAELMQDNPLSKLPTLVLDDGRSLFDSFVICEYLDGLHAGRRDTKSGPRRWDVLRWPASQWFLDLLVLWATAGPRIASSCVTSWRLATKTAHARRLARESGLEAAPSGRPHRHCLRPRLPAFRFPQQAGGQAPRLAACHNAVRSPVRAEAGR